MCLSKDTMYTGSNSVVLTFCSKAACIVNVCTCKELNCYFFYFLLRILWLQLNLIALCHNQGDQSRSNYANNADNTFTTTITLNISSDAAEVQNLTAGWQNKVCIRIWKKVSQSMQQGPVLQCHKKENQDQEIKYTCTFGSWSVCRTTCDSTNDSGGLRSFFLMIIIKISFDTIHESVFNWQ